MFLPPKKRIAQKVDKNPRDTSTQNSNHRIEGLRLYAQGVVVLLRVTEFDIHLQ